MPASITRDRSTRLLFSILIALLAFVAAISPAGAGRGWCRTDPVILVDGQIVNVLISSTPEALTAVTGPTTVEIAVPEGTTAELLATDAGFGRGYAVAFVTAPDLKATPGVVEVRVSVLVPASVSLPVLVEVTVANGTLRARRTGESGAWVTASARV